MTQSGKYYKILQVSFFLSGACGLIYETVWHRMLHLVFGSSVFATATVLSAFMTGLALGSFYFGKKTDALKNPLRLYAYLEIGIGVSAVFFPVLLSGTTDLYIGIHRVFETYPILSAFLKFLLCFTILLIPSSLMGGTLPAAVRFVTRDLRTVGNRVGVLYGLNTLGAVVGCIAAGYFLIVALGARETTYLAALINCAIGSVILFLGKDAGPAESGPLVEKTLPRKDRNKAQSEDLPRPLLALLLITAGVSGFCALAYEVLWTRALVFSIISSIYAFPTMLASFLCGSAIGSLIITRFSREQNTSFILLAFIQILIGVSALVTIWEFTAIFSLSKSLDFLQGGNWLSTRLIHLITAFSIMLIPSMFMGMIVPLISRLYTQRLVTIGKSVGNVYAVNTVGAVLGSLAAGFLLVPYGGIARGIIIAAALNMLMGGVLLFTKFPFQKKSSVRYLVAGTGTVLAVFLVFLFSKQMPMMLYSAIYLIRSEAERVLYYKEGKGSTVSVIENKPNPYNNKRYKHIDVNGVPVAGESREVRITQKVQGHFPPLLYKAMTGRDPQYVFQLGLGTGESAYCIALHNIKRVDCVEIAAAEIGANPLFDDINHGILDNPKFRLTIDDARNFLLTTQTRYDIIENDSVHPGVNITTYTKEYFELARDRLTESGIFSSWIPLFSLSEDNLKIMMKTMLEVFPHVMVWYSTNYHNVHALLMGSKQEMVLDYTRLIEEMNRVPIKANLAELWLDDPIDILSSFIIDERIMRSYASDAPINDDNRMILPYYITRQKIRGEKTVPHILGILKDLSTSFSPHIINYETVSPDLKDDLAVGIQVRNLLIDAIIHKFENDVQQTIDDYTEALALLPGDPKITYMRNEVRFNALLNQGSSLMRGGSIRQAKEVMTQAIRIKPDAAYPRNALGSILARMGLLDEALKEFNIAVQHTPDSAELQSNLAMVYYNMGRMEEAREHCLRSLDLDPEDEKTRKLYKRLL